MKVLVASTPASGHIDPMFSLARILVGAGHQVAGLSATAFRARIESAGAKFFPFPDRADFDLRDISIAFPAYKTISPGIEMSRFYLEKVFIDAIPAQVEGLREALRVFSADVILGDDFFLGALPILLGPRSERPAVVLCGTTFLHYRRDDGAPNFVGLPPATSRADLEAYAAIAEEHEELLYAPTRRYFNACLAALDVGPLAMDPHEAVITLPDAYLQLTVPSFEFPRRNLPRSVRFVGTPPLVPGQASIPEWAAELDGSRKVVLVTQGTLSNLDLGQLIVPTMAALAEEPDLLVVVTGGGRSSSALPGPIPSNVRFASYLPFEWLLPKTDLLVTNGGYGSLNQALSFGIPIVSAGLSEDKADVNARVAWSGVGIDLKAQQPSESALHQAIRRVLDLPNYRQRALAVSEEFARLDGRSRILSILERASAGSETQSAERAPIECRRYSGWVE